MSDDRTDVAPRRWPRGSPEPTGVDRVRSIRVTWTRDAATARWTSPNGFSYRWSELSAAYALTEVPPDEPVADDPVADGPRPDDPDADDAPAAATASNDPAFSGVGVRLTYLDGNAFAVLSRVRRALVDAGHREAGDRFVDEALGLGSYDELLRLVMRTVEVW